MARRLVPLDLAAKYLGCTERTVRNYISAGHFPAYRVPRSRGLLVSLDEVDAWRATVPGRVAHVGYGSYGPKARIVDLADQAVPVRAESAQ
jgi:excisionase family DNA binding protein